MAGIGARRGEKSEVTEKKICRMNLLIRHALVLSGKQTKGDVLCPSGISCSYWMVLHALPPRFALPSHLLFPTVPKNRIEHLFRFLTHLAGGLTHIGCGITDSLS